MEGERGRGSIAEALGEPRRAVLTASPFKGLGLLAGRPAHWKRACGSTWKGSVAGCGSGGIEYSSIRCLMVRLGSEEGKLQGSGGGKEERFSFAYNERGVGLGAQVRGQGVEERGETLKSFSLLNTQNV